MAAFQFSPEAVNSRTCFICEWRILLFLYTVLSFVSFPSVCFDYTNNVRKVDATIKQNSKQQKSSN
ncbi:CLUMA_CG003949, isoform A [Clunio marinus]|uniref:CLUMA_CG003949, isoform A n=1 Tax=Clunio marinus TaxID=568069 RepID=A0A1J1HS75_9DIPT|nr:CLUMA_CG003949, isoform A [Clunio marinus]